jgi:hypothetical protein
MKQMDVLKAEGRKQRGEEGYSAEITVITVEAGGKGVNDHESMRLLLVSRSFFETNDGSA